MFAVHLRIAQKLLSHATPLALAFTLVTIPLWGPQARASEAPSTSGCGQASPQDFKNSTVREALAALKAGKIQPTEAFSQGWNARRFSQGREERNEAEYLMASALAEGKLLHSAHAAFAALLSQASPAPRNPAQEGAWICLAQLSRTLPSLKLPRNLVARLPNLIQSGTERAQKAGREHALGVLMSQLKPGDSSPRELLLKLLEGDAELHARASLWLAARTHDLPKILHESEQLLTALKAQPASAGTDLQTIHLLRGEAFFGAKRYREAAEELKLVEKKDNHSTEALQALAWSHLQGERYGDAIGVSSSMQTGALRKAFTPESWMITAIALQELCHYSEALKTVNRYRKHHRATLAWIQQWESAPTALYGQTVKFLKTGDSGSVPPGLATEWLKSPVFQKGQSELNVLLQQTEVLGIHQKQAQETQRRIRGELQKAVAAAEKPTEADEHRLAVQEVRLQWKKLRRFNASFPLWKKLAEKASRSGASRQARVMGEIQQDLAHRTRLAGTLLNEIAENLERLEIEIYGEASEDIVWRQAHPEFKGRGLASQSGEAGTGSEVWNWGTLASGEIWEDELDSFRADLSNHCDDKDRHLEDLRKRLPKRAAAP